MNNIDLPIAAVLQAPVLDRPLPGCFADRVDTAASRSLLAIRLAHLNSLHAS